MALTRAQYLAPGGSSPALAGQVQGVKQGTGITIAADGTISFNAGSAIGVVTSVAASGGTTGLTFSGSPITSSGTFTLGGVLGIANGGTGATTQQGVANNVLPPQAGNAGRYLTTDGSVVSWGAVAPGGVTQIVAGSNVSVSPVTGTGVVTISATGGTGSAQGLLQIDDISAGFNGSTTTFLLQSGGVNLPATTGTSQLVIAIGGILQTPGASGAFTFNTGTSQITFTAAPPAGTTFAGFVGTSQQTGPAGPPGPPGPSGVGVTQIVAGTNVTISPAGGTGVVTINATGGGTGGGNGLASIDDISASFNGTTTAFLLQEGASNLPSYVTAPNLILEVGGVIQPPGSAYTYDSATSTVTFTSAPTAGLDFSGRYAIVAPAGPPGPPGPATGGDVPAGSRIVFVQAAAPTGWTQVTTSNNVALRLVSGTGAGTGGSQPFTSAFTTYTPSGSVALSGLSVSGTVNGSSLTVGQLAQHTHNIALSQFTYGPGAGVQQVPAAGGTPNTIQNTGNNESHSHGWSGSVSGSGSFSGSSSSQFAVQYVDAILCSKD